MRKCSFLLAIVLASPVFGKEKPVPPEPTEHPDWAVMREQGESQMKNSLFDPVSAQIQYSSGFQWGFLKPLIGGRTHGWIACGSVNAKNRMGGYVGAKGFLIFVRQNREVTFDLTENWNSTCDTGPAVAVQPELSSPVITATSQGSAPTVAEEIGKLAELRDKGIITQVEFEAQKAKLLARP